MTAEKEQAIGAMVEPVVVVIQNYLEENFQQRVFEESHFESILNRFKVKQTKWKYALADAGLYKHGRVLIGEKQRTVWLRKEDQFVAARGRMSPQVRLPNGDLHAVAEMYRKPDF
jgi:hypothetical protein